VSQTQDSRIARGVSAGIVALGVGAALAAGAVLLAAGVAVVTSVFARLVVTPPKTKREDLRIIAVDTSRGEITLESTVDSRLPGRYSLWFDQDAGHARLGEIVAATADSVTRTISKVDFGEPATASRGRLGGWFHLGPWELGLPYENVVVETPLGPAPAWLVPAPRGSSRWVIHVHGRAARRQECLRAVETVRGAGFASLVISYRNDGEAPESSDGRYGLGDTEWADVAAAIAFAQEHGARHVVLMGWSMGGAIVLQTIARAPVATRLVRGIVLESPAVDWLDVLEFQGESYRLPGVVRRAVVSTLSERWGGPVTGLDEPIDFVRLDVAARAADLSVPILLFHSDDDGFVPIAGAERLARARPDLVTFERFTVATHTKLWNYDPGRWTGALGDWLVGLKQSMGRRRR
jgi:uncharacterized protein